MAVGCRIKRNFVRPDRALVEAFRGIPVANIDDCMGRLAAVDAGLEPMNHSPCWAPPLPCCVPPATT